MMKKLMFRIIRASFNQRRKTLVNGLKNSGELEYTKEAIEQAMSKCGLPFNIRGEAMTLDQFAQLSDFPWRKFRIKEYSIEPSPCGETVF